MGSDHTDHHSKRKHETKSSTSKRKRTHKHDDSDNDDNNNEGNNSNDSVADTLISEADYYRLSLEFRTWLLTKKSKHLDELDTATAKDYYFKKFVKRWNAGKLSANYYNGTVVASTASLPATDRTKYCWSFTKNQDEDLFKAERTRDTVAAMTDAPRGKEANLSNNTSAKPKVVYGASLPPFATPLATEKSLSRRAQKEFLEELVPKESGREAKIQERRAQNALRRREDDSADLDIDDATLMGESSHMKSERELRRDAYLRKKEDEIRQKSEKFKAAEEQKMAYFQDLARQHLLRKESGSG